MSLTKRFELREKRLSELKYLMVKISDKTLDLIEIKLFVQNTLIVDDIDLMKYIKPSKMETDQE